MRAKPGFGEWATGPGDCHPQYSDLWSNVISVAPVLEGGGRVSHLLTGGLPASRMVPWYSTSESAGGIAWDDTYGSALGTSSGGPYWASSGAVGSFSFDEVTCVIVCKTAPTSSVGQVICANTGNGNNGWRLNHTSAHALQFTLNGVADYPFGQTLSASTWYVIAFTYSDAERECRIAFRKLHDQAITLDVLTSMGALSGSPDELAFGSRYKGTTTVATTMSLSFFGVFRGFHRGRFVDLCGDPYSWAYRDSAAAYKAPAAPPATTTKGQLVNRQRLTTLVGGILT